MKRRNSKNKKILLLLLVLLLITIGFALLSTTLRIGAFANISKNNWNIYWDENSIELNPGSYSQDAPTVINDSNKKKTIVTWSNELNLPGDYYEFTVDAVNASAQDAMITSIVDGIPNNLPNYISVSVTYDNGVEPRVNDILPKGTLSGFSITPTKQKYKFRVEYLDTVTATQINAVTGSGIELEFSYEIQYGEADSNAVTPGVFETYSWDDLIDEYNNGNPSKSLQAAMTRGIKRKVDLDLDYDGDTDLQANLRIANLSTPSECGHGSYSQTACGFVIEFAEIVTTHKMNYYNKSRWSEDSGEGTWGGWKYSDIRAYLNGGTYERENIDYSGISFMDTLPSDLQSAIIDTRVSSASWHAGHPESAMVTDKLYFLTPTEVYGTGAENEDLQYDQLAASTRQLDYYNLIGLQADEDNYSKAIKPVLNPDQQVWENVPEGWSIGYWGLRSSYASSGIDSSFFRVMNDGTIGYTYSCHGHGVSPAFRIAEVSN